MVTLVDVVPLIVVTLHVTVKVDVTVSPEAVYALIELAPLPVFTSRFILISVLGVAADWVTNNQLYEEVLL